MSATRPLVIYHANCADGFSAAWCFWSVFKDEFEYYPGHHGKPPPVVEGRDVYMVDFSYSAEIVREMLKVAKSVTLIDHHKTAIDELSPLSSEGLKLCVDLERSGATLAWDFLHRGEDIWYRPPLLGHIEDRDLWRFKLPMTREISAAVFSYEYTFENWDEMMRSGFLGIARLSATGEALERKHQKDIHEIVRTCLRSMNIGGYDVPVVNIPYTMGSDAASLMAVDHPFAAYYSDTHEHRVFGLRSTKDVGMDVSLVAKQYGGGGHKHASGFKVARDHDLARE